MKILMLQLQRRADYSMVAALRRLARTPLRLHITPTLSQDDCDHREFRKITAKAAGERKNETAGLLANDQNHAGTQGSNLVVLL
jgi:hypothetical protein